LGDTETTVTTLDTAPANMTMINGKVVVLGMRHKAKVDKADVKNRLLDVEKQLPAAEMELLDAAIGPRHWPGERLPRVGS
jgi:hypothetical protein